ncbi:MAG: hypothetical protein ACP5O8_00165 [Candidatus Aenigmatarchaeota archaeon]
MPNSNNVEEVYLDAVKKLRASFPKFVIFLGLAYIVWLLYSHFFFQLSKESTLGNIEVVRLDSLLIISAVVVLILSSFVEIKNVADACAGLVTSYISSAGKIEEIRVRKVRRAFRTTFYILPFTVAYLIFSNLLEQVFPLLTTIIPLVIVIWVVVASIFLAMVLGLELEEAANNFIQRLRKIKPKK